MTSVAERPDIRQQSKAKVFISYSRKDIAFVDRLEAALKARGFEPLIDRAEIYAFEAWWQRIEKLIAAADTVVFVLSPDSAASEVALKEVTFAASLNKRFAPIVHRRVADKDVPEALARLNFIFFDDAAQFDVSADRLAEALGTDIGWVRQHTDFGESARRWAITDKPSGLLLRSPVLEQAERWIAARPDGAPEPTAETQSFIRLSRQGATRRRNVLTGSLAAGLVLALGLAGLAYWQRGVAVEQTQIAEERRQFAEQQQTIAVEQRALAEKNEAQAKEERDRATRNFALAQKTAESLVFDIAQGLRNVQGMRAESVRKILETARATFDQLAAAAPDDLALQRSRGAMLLEFGDTYRALGDLAQALATYRDSLTIFERLTAADRSNPRWQRSLSVAYGSIGDVLVAQGRLDDALKTYRDSLTIRERLAAQDRDNTLSQRDLSIAYEWIGNVLVAQGRLDEALKNYRDGLIISERLTASDRSNTEWQRDLSVSYNKVGDILIRQGRLDEAIKAYRDSLAIFERLAAADRGNMQWQHDLSTTYYKVGDVLIKQGRLDEGLDAYRHGLANFERLAAADRSNATWQRDLSVLYERVGVVLGAQRRLDEALTAYRQSLAIRQRLAAADGSNTDWQRDLAVSYFNVGQVLEEQDKLEDALKLYRDGVAIAARLASADRSNKQWQRDLQYTAGKIGDLAYRLVLARHHIVALEAVDQAISLLPDGISFRENRAHALMFLDRIDEARTIYLQHRGQKNVQGRAWEAIVLDDFAELRKAGLTHPLMDEIEKRFAAAG